MSVYTVILIGMFILLVAVLAILRVAKGSHGQAENEHTDVGECGTIFSGPNVHTDTEQPSRAAESRPRQRAGTSRQVREKGPGRQ